MTGDSGEGIPQAVAAALLLLVSGTVVQAAEADADPAAEAQNVVAELARTLGQAMQQAMASGGPAAAIEVCRDRAPALTSELSRRHGWRITRVGTRVRNPLLGTPDAWEQQVLADFERRRQAGEPLKNMAFHAVVEEPAGPQFRYMKAIGVQPLCLTCHGDPAAIPDPVRAVLAREYPHDAATGYRAGDLRGAFSVKRAMQP
ncbi:Tll0287-like domain-containing protein [Thiohalobacter sp.]|uniref:Tll0287-like domain-containing protein n=1 Tax=Thiohalobacter sp. TaxID=2025948 RepID=UPI0026224473|nr:DUF3365 domain-containing protein [Thiohalobacter sp.]